MKPPISQFDVCRACLDSQDASRTIATIIVGFISGLVGFLLGAWIF